MADDKDKILGRLRRIEGQVRGLERMVAEGSDCLQILTQLAAVSAALKKTGLEMVNIHLGTCLSDIKNSNDATRDQKMGELKELLGRFLALP